MGNNLWGVEQCICTDPGKSIPTKCYPSRYDFASKATYLGREKLHVEYMWKDMVLDHWNTWAHHIWTDPETKNIVRMWKPWSGLQIFPPEAWKASVEDNSVFEVPPPQCKKGGAKVRITCDDDGHYQPKNESEMAAVTHGALLGGVLLHLPCGSDGHTREATNSDCVGRVGKRCRSADRVLAPLFSSLFRQRFCLAAGTWASLFPGELSSVSLKLSGWWKMGQGGFHVTHSARP